jgi:hypothetical protein
LYEFISSTNEADLTNKLNKFEEKNKIKKVTYCTCAYAPDLLHKIWHSIMIEYEPKQ